MSTANLPSSLEKKDSCRLPKVSSVLKLRARHESRGRRMQRFAHLVKQTRMDTVDGLRAQFGRHQRKEAVAAKFGELLNKGENAARLGRIGHKTSTAGLRHEIQEAGLAQIVEAVIERLAGLPDEIGDLGNWPPAARGLRRKLPVLGEFHTDHFLGFTGNVMVTSPFPSGGILMKRLTVWYDSASTSRR